MNINSRYEFQEKWDDEIEYPLKNFVQEIIIGFLANFRISDT